MSVRGRNRQDKAFVLYYWCLINKNHVNADLLAYVDSWADLDNQLLGMKLTDLFGCRIETWALSPSLYNSLDKVQINKFINYVGEHSLDYSIGQSIPFNLFEGLI